MGVKGVWNQYYIIWIDHLDCFHLVDSHNLMG